MQDVDLMVKSPLLRQNTAETKIIVGALRQ